MLGALMTASLVGSGYNHLGGVSLEAYMRIVSPMTDEALGMRWGITVEKEFNLNKIVN